MGARQLTEAITNGAIRSVNFFNGRLLTAEDLSQEQGVRRQADALLGKALGDGIAFGLEVQWLGGSLPQVNVQPGVAINRKGQALSLADATDVSLVRPTTPPAIPAGTFKDCQPPQPGVYAADAGVYLLVICPAAATEGRAPANGLGNTTPSCGARYKIDAVQFRLIPLTVASPLSQPALLRNRVAHECFGVVADTALMARSPFDTPWVRTGLLEVMRANNIGLTDCDVPLALLYWTAAGIQYVDMWSVRRRITAPGAAVGWPLLTGDRRASEAEAMFQQFQDQVDAAAGEPNPQTIDAASRFEYLPPAGMIPVQTQAAPKGFNPATFFGAFASSGIGTIDGAQLRPLFQEALAHEPIHLAAGERVRLYVTFENLTAAQNQVVPGLTLIFASRYLGKRAAARFDYGNFSLDNFATTVVR